MDGFLYTELVEDKFDDWRSYCDYLVCDFEKCLRTDAAVRALKRSGLQLVENYPKCSQNFNAIGNVWGVSRERLNETQPTALERRDEFIKRLLAAVRLSLIHI